MSRKHFLINKMSPSTLTIGLCPKGEHLLAEYSGCDPAVLNDVDLVKPLMIKAAEAANTRVVASVFRPFEPQGVTGVVIIEESHLSIHTWPEHGYASVDFFTCGAGIPELAHTVLFQGLRASRAEILRIHRGLGTSPSMEVGSHKVELWEAAETSNRE